MPVSTISQSGLDAPISLTSPTLTTPNIDSAQVPTVSGTAPLYMCRAWVNFNGTTASPSTIRGSGNVTSVTKNGTGDYTLNFTTAMSDANYSLVGTVQFDTTGNEASHNLMGLEIKCVATPLTTTSARVAGKYGGSTATYDMNTVAVAIFR